MNDQHTAQNANNKNFLDGLFSTLTILDKRITQEEHGKQLNLQVSQEFLGARFDAKG